MTWVLVVFVASFSLQPAVAVTSVEMGSKSLCEAAAKKVVEQTQKAGRVTAVCLQKDVDAKQVS